MTEDYPKLRAFVRAHPTCAPGSIAFYFDAAVVNCSCGAQFVEPMNGTEEELGIRRAVQSEVSKIQSPLHDEVGRFAIPFVIGVPAPFSGAQRGLSARSFARERRAFYEAHVATCVAVQVEGHSGFLITARHVAEKAISEINSTPEFVCNAGFLVTVSQHLSKASLGSETYDVATTPLGDDDLSLLETNGYRIVRARTWPPCPDLSVDDSVIAVGYPGASRRISPDVDAPWGSYGDRVRTLNAEQFSFLLHGPVRSRELAPGWTEDMVAKDHLPGFSGGPAMKVCYGALKTLELCGIVKEGHQFSDDALLLYCARLEAVQADGRVLW